MLYERNQLLIGCLFPAADGYFFIFGISTKYDFLGSEGLNLARKFVRLFYRNAAARYPLSATFARNLHILGPL